MSNLTEEGHHQHSDKVQAGLEEDDSSDSPRRVVLKLPPLEADSPASNKSPVSRTPRKKTYKKVAYDSVLTSKRCKRKKGRNDSEAHTLALKSAKEKQANLSSEHPSFTKQLQRSHVTGDCQLGIPSDFSRSHMPTRNDEVILEDENGESYMVKFSPSSEGKFIGGWKKFSLEHNLLEGDVIVFHLIKPCYFKDEYENYQTNECCMTKRVKIDVRAHTSALKSAKKLQTNLWRPTSPSFIKQMQRTHVIGNSTLAVPGKFCRRHMPPHDVDVTLDDERGESYTVKFVPRARKAFVDGWKDFSTAHNLLEGDVLVFHLLSHCHFKVYIVRVNDPTTVGFANLASFNVNGNNGKEIKCQATDKESHELAQDTNTVQENFQGSLSLPNHNLDPGWDHAITEELHSSDVEADASYFKNLTNTEVEACLFSGSDADFEKFKIKVNNEIVDRPELSRSTRFNYYQLCCSRKSCLHDNLLKNVSPTLAAEMIKATLELAYGIRGYNLSTSEDDVAMWARTLAGLKNFGMDVGFLFDRLKQLERNASEFKGTEDMKRYVQAKDKRDCIGEEMRRIVVKFQELKKSADILESEMKTIEVNVQKYDGTLQEQASAPW